MSLATAGHSYGIHSDRKTRNIRSIGQFKKEINRLSLSCKSVKRVYFHKIFYYKIVTFLITEDFTEV